VNHYKNIYDMYRSDILSIGHKKSICNKLIKKLHQKYFFINKNIKKLKLINSSYNYLFFKKICSKKSIVNQLYYYYKRKLE